MTIYLRRKKDWKPARVMLLWNHFARGAFFNDQASFASAFQSVNIMVDTVFLGQPLHPDQHNLLIVPASIVDSLTDEDYFCYNELCFIRRKYCS